MLEVLVAFMELGHSFLAVDTSLLTLCSPRIYVDEPNWQDLSVDLRKWLPKILYVHCLTLTLASFKAS